MVQGDNIMNKGVVAISIYLIIDYFIMNNLENIFSISAYDISDFILSHFLIAVSPFFLISKDYKKMVIGLIFILFSLDALIDIYQHYGNIYFIFFSFSVFFISLIIIPAKSEVSNG